MKVPAGRAEVAQGSHDASVVPAAAHGYFRERVTLPALVVAAADAGARLLTAVALLVVGWRRRVVRGSGRTGMAGRRQLAHVQLAALPGGGGGQRRGAEGAGGDGG